MRAAAAAAASRSGLKVGASGRVLVRGSCRRTTLEGVELSECSFEDSPAGSQLHRPHHAITPHDQVLHHSDLPGVAVSRLLLNDYDVPAEGYGVWSPPHLL